MKTKLVLALAVLMAGAALGWSFKPDPPPVYERVEVPVGAMLELEPKFELSWLRDPLEKLVRRSLQPAQRAVARGGARVEVLEFCRPLIERRDALEAPELPPVPVVDRRALLIAYRVKDPWFPFAAHKVEHFGATNAGDRLHDTFYGRGTIEGGVLADSTVATGERWGWVKPAVQVGVPLGLGLIGGRASCTG